MSRAPRIGLLASSLRGYNTLDGGIGAHFADLAVALAAEGVAVTVITPSPELGATAREADLAGIDIVPFSFPLPRWLDRLAGLRWRLHTAVSRRWKIRAASTELLAAHRLRSFDCVETSSTGALALGALAARDRPPLVVRVSTTADQLVSHNGGQPGWHDRLEQAWELRLVRGAERVITHTPGHRDEICARWGLEPATVAVVPHGIALPPAHEVPPPVARPVRFLFVGRFEHRKGIDVLLAAIPQVLAAEPDVHFTLAGLDTGNRGRDVFLSQNPRLREHVDFAGRLDATALRAAYRSCDVFVAPSRYESFGLTYVEAMAWAKPVLGCRAGGVPDVVIDETTGLLVPPGDTPALTAALLRLARDPALRARLGSAARADVDARFSRQTLARASLAVYRATSPATP
ncbi:MAG: glycosyltransferase family 4 protein [Opitutaceae bacterium]|jgi:hypothetical protein|nr:glycosyltransferase family 4 protein [Opitutaceae bacterium]